MFIFGFEFVVKLHFKIRILQILKNFGIFKKLLQNLLNKQIIPIQTLFACLI